MNPSTAGFGTWLRSSRIRFEPGAILYGPAVKWRCSTPGAAPAAPGKAAATHAADSTRPTTIRFKDPPAAHALPAAIESRLHRPWDARVPGRARARDSRRLEPL